MELVVLEVFVDFEQDAHVLAANSHANIVRDKLPLTGTNRDFDAWTIPGGWKRQLNFLDRQQLR
jgi:hypothetical protein